MTDPRIRIRFQLGLALFCAWVAFLGWMAFTSAKPPADRGLPANVKPM